MDSVLFDAMKKYSEDGGLRAEALKAAIDKGAPLNSVNEDDSTPLMEAALYGYPECVQLLLEAGADVNETGSNDTTPLLSSLSQDPYMNVTSDGRFKCLSLLLKAGASVYTTDAQGITPLMAAAYLCDVKCIKAIIDAGYRKYRKKDLTDSSQGVDSVVLPGSSKISDTIASDKTENNQITDSDTVAAKTVDPGDADGDSNSDSDNCRSLSDDTSIDDINLTDYMECRNALHHCLASDNTGEAQVQCLKLLIEAGTDVNFLEGSSRPLILATTSLPNSLELVKCLLDAGAVFKPQDLMEAVRVVNADLITEFLKRGGDVNGLDCWADTPLHNLIYNIKRNSLRSRFPELDNKTKRCMKLLVEANSDINVCNRNILQPIHTALLLWPFFQFPAEYLISENCDLNNVSFVKVTSVSYFTVHHYYTSDFKLKMANFLFQCGLSFSLCKTFIDESDPPAIGCWVKSVTSQPRTLSSLCIFNIRNLLGLHIKSQVENLNLPDIIKGYILLKNILPEECFV